MKSPSRWGHIFDFYEEVVIAVSGESGVVVGKLIGNRYVVRYCRADGVAVEAEWAQDALIPPMGSQEARRPVELKVVS